MATKTAKRKNKYLPLVILLVVFVVMLIAYSALSSANDKKEAISAAEEARANADIIIANYDASTVTKLSYQVAGHDKLTFLCSNGTQWTYADDTKFPLNQTIVASMASAISSIGVECEVSEGSEADYGLDTPAYTISVTYSDNTSRSYRIGDYNSFNSSYYFAAESDIYMISSGLIPYFSYELSDLMVLDTLPTTDWSDMNYVTEITVSTPDGTNVISDEDGKNAFINKLGSISLKNCADYYAENEEKAEYGLDGSKVITVKYKKAVTSTNESGNSSTNYLETNYSINIGEAVGHNDGYYVAPANSNIVYVVDEKTVLELLAYLDYVPTADEAVTEAESAE